MSYSPKEWRDRVVDRPRTYFFQGNPDGSTTLVPAPGTIHEPGTPANAPNFNHIEQGIADVDALANSIDSQKITVISAIHADVPGTEYPMGLSTMAVNAGTNGFLFAGSVLNNKVGTSTFTQLLTASSGTGTAFARMAFRRWRAVEGWSDWVEVLNNFGGQTLKGYLNFEHGGGGDVGVVGADAGAGRGFLMLRSGGGISSADASIYLYKGNDSGGNAGRIVFNAGGSSRLQLYPDGRLLLGGNEVWSTGQLRWNAAGYLEYNLNGTWIPTGDFPLGALRNFDRNVTSGNGYTVARQWYTVFETSLPGRIESLFGQTEFTGRMEMRITIDGQAETIGDMDYDPGVSIGQTYPYVVQGEPPLTFRQGLKIEARARDMATAAKNLVSMRYRLRAGSP